MEGNGEREWETRGREKRTRQPGIKYICFLTYQISIDGSYLPCTGTHTNTHTYSLKLAKLKINYLSIYVGILETHTHTHKQTDTYSVQVKVAGVGLPSCAAARQLLNELFFMCIHSHPKSFSLYASQALAGSFYRSAC